MNAEDMAKMCLTKKRYSKGTAEKVAQRVRDERDHRVRAYYCPVCFKWHLTKSKER